MSSNAAATVENVAQVVTAVDPLILAIINWIKGYQAASNGQFPDPAVVTAAFARDSAAVQSLWAAWTPKS